MMRWRYTAARISTRNEYSHLIWPLTIASLLTTLLAFIIFLSFRSNLWFIFDLIEIDTKLTISNTTSYSRVFEYGTLGLWSICINRYNEFNLKCEQWTKENRPNSFNVIILLLSWALFLSNLIVFPSWSTSILIFYNSNNRYVRHITCFIWILFILMLSLTILLIMSIILASTTLFYSPGQFVLGAYHLYFHCSSGFNYAVFAMILAIICLLLIIFALIWKKIIEIKLMEAEKILIKQLSDDNYKPGWHKIVMAPRTPMTNDMIGDPPPYRYPN